MNSRRVQQNAGGGGGRVRLDGLSKRATQSCLLAYHQELACRILGRHGEM